MRKHTGHVTLISNAESHQKEPASEVRQARVHQNLYRGQERANYEAGYKSGQNTFELGQELNSIDRLARGPYSDGKRDGYHDAQEQSLDSSKGNIK